MASNEQQGDNASSCGRCHRSLRDPVSRTAGYGPVCRVKLGLRTGQLPRLAAEPASRSATRARWSFILDGDFVLLEDLDGSMSVTNDAEAVVAELARRCPLRGRRVLYRDSAGRWDELLVKAGRFAGFSPIGANSAADALAVAKALGTQLAGVAAMRAAYSKLHP